MVCRFLLGIPLEPPRAGIRARALGVAIIGIVADALSYPMIQHFGYRAYEILFYCSCQPTRFGSSTPITMLNHDTLI